jgi:hypothetical protein
MILIYRAITRECVHAQQKKAKCRVVTNRIFSYFMEKACESSQGHSAIDRFRFAYPCQCAIIEPESFEQSFFLVNSLIKLVFDLLWPFGVPLNCSSQKTRCSVK